MWVILLYVKKRIFAVLLCLFLLVPMPVLASTGAQSAVVMDAAGHTVLYEQNAYEERPMASTTKIMTAYLACAAGDLQRTVPITAAMLKDTEGSSLGLHVGDRITLYDLVVGMLLVSGNDAANAAAIFLSGSTKAFAAKMNSAAKEMGMHHTHFVTPSGLDRGDHHSTAYDMALLTAHALQNKTFAEICAAPRAKVTINGKSQTVYNHNRLLTSLDGCVGVKTGYTERAGRCLVSAVKYKGNTLICVTLSDPDDWVDHRRLLDACKKQYTTYKLDRHVQVPVVGGRESYVTAEFRYSQTALNATYTVRLYYYPFIYAPVKKGDVIGYACINQITVPMRAQEDIEIYATEE